MTERKPSALPTSASPMPVLPAVPSTITPPGRSVPLRTASWMMNSAARSLTDWPGIHELGLAQDGAAGRLGGALEPDQRRIADGSDDSVADLHWPIRWVRRGPNVKDGPRADKRGGGLARRPGNSRRVQRICSKAAEIAKDCRNHSPAFGAAVPRYSPIFCCRNGRCPAMGIVSSAWSPALLFGSGSMNLDVNTLFLVTIYVEAILGLLLLFAWVQNTADPRGGLVGIRRICCVPARSCCSACTGRCPTRSRSISPTRCCS